MDIFFGRPKDIDEIFAIEKSSFPDPWSRNALELALEDTHGGIIAASSDGRICGYAVYHCAFEEAELFNLAVRPDARGMGAGRALVEAVRAEVRRRGAEKLFLEVRRGNAAARGLYESVGFKTVGVRAGYYETPPDDAIIMELEV